MTMEWIIELEPGVWIAPWSGDPGRTLVQGSAKRFQTHDDAKKALAKARAASSKKFAGAKITKASPPVQGREAV
jgi:hypothetical protein